MTLEAKSLSLILGVFIYLIHLSFHCRNQSQSLITKVTNPSMLQLYSAKNFLYPQY
jgi:hypothetical protein